MKGARLRRWGGGLAVIVLFSGLTACSDDPTQVPRSSWSSPSTSRTSTSAPDSEEGQVEIPNDLAKRPLKRKLNAGPLTVDVRYDTPISVKKWRPDRSKPLRISLKAVNRDKKKQKIYLTKATANITAYDNQGQIGDARTVSDSADVNPGFIVTAPNTYNESLAIPPLDSGSMWMTVDLTYELVMEVERTKQGRDFAKQVATDTLTVPLAS